MIGVCASKDQRVYVCIPNCGEETASHLNFWEPRCLNSTSHVEPMAEFTILCPPYRPLSTKFKPMNSVAMCCNLVHVPCPKAKVSMVTVRRERPWKMPLLRHCGLNLDIFVSKIFKRLSDTIDLFTSSWSTTHTLHWIVYYICNFD